jgi:hypothetical protein
VSPVVLADVRYTDEVERHIREDHPPLTASKVKQALIYAKDAVANWEENVQHGHQVAVFATTIDGIPFKAYLHPVNPDDPDQGSFDLNTAFILQRRTQHE